MPIPQDIADKLVEWIGDGKTLRAFCRQEGYPSKSTIYVMLDENPKLAGRIARARDEGHDAIADECMEIIDTATDANLGKARVWTRLQLLAKWNPKKYGERLENVHSGSIDLGLAEKMTKALERAQKAK